VKRVLFPVRVYALYPLVSRGFLFYPELKEHIPCSTLFYTFLLTPGPWPPDSPLLVGFPTVSRVLKRVFLSGFTPLSGSWVGVWEC